MSDVDQVAAALVGLLSDEGRKPPRVLARKIAEHLEALDLLHNDTVTAEEPPAGQLVGASRRTDPPTWLRFAATLDNEVPVAVTRNRTDSAIAALGLDVDQMRAVVIERDWIRVYRYTDRTAAQTMPILEESA